MSRDAIEEFPVDDITESGIEPAITVRSGPWGIYPQFARTHMESAATLTRRASAIEQDLGIPTTPSPVEAYDIRYARDNEGDERYREHRACVIGAVLTSVAAIDAAVCEVFVDAYAGWMDTQDKERKAHQSGNIFSAWLPPLVPELACKWADERFRKVPLMERATEAARIAGTDLGSVPSWGAVDDVVQFRHVLTHYTGGVVWAYLDTPGRPVPDPDPVQKMLEKRKKVLGNKGVRPTPLGHGLIFPYSHLGYPCAVWAVKTSQLAIGEFYHIMGKRSPLDDAEEDDVRMGRPPRFALTPATAGELSEPETPDTRTPGTGSRHDES